MNNQRLSIIASQMSSIAKKVLDAVPIQESWSIRQICSELVRQGSNADLRAVSGCLSTLKDSGLVKEPKPAHFIRVMIDVEPAAQKPKTAKVVDMPFMPVVATDPMGRMAAVAVSLRDAAKQFNLLAIEAEEAALAMEGELEKARADNDKLKQLQALLKSIGQ